jgi:hypothetical protein
MISKNFIISKGTGKDSTTTFIETHSQFTFSWNLWKNFLMIEEWEVKWERLFKKKDINFENLEK